MGKWPFVEQYSDGYSGTHLLCNTDRHHKCHLNTKQVVGMLEMDPLQPCCAIISLERQDDFSRMCCLNLLSTLLILATSWHIIKQVKAGQLFPSALPSLQCIFTSMLTVMNIGLIQSNNCDHYTGNCNALWSTSWKKPCLHLRLLI